MMFAMLHDLSVACQQLTPAATFGDNPSPSFVETFQIWDKCLPVILCLFMVILCLFVVILCLFVAIVHLFVSSLCLFVVADTPRFTSGPLLSTYTHTQTPYHHAVTDTSGDWLMDRLIMPEGEGRKMKTQWCKDTSISDMQRKCQCNFRGIYRKDPALYCRKSNVAFIQSIGFEHVRCFSNSQILHGRKMSEIFRLLVPERKKCVQTEPTPTQIWHSLHFFLL